LFREVTRDVFLHGLSFEHAVVAAIALYPCHAHTSVLLLYIEADFSAREC